jgi:hypothetical protein
MLQRWLSRFSFTFLILAALCAWEIYNIGQGRRGFVPQWKIALYYVAGIVSAVLGAIGIRARHRSNGL